MANTNAMIASELKKRISKHEDEAARLRGLLSEFDGGSVPKLGRKPGRKPGKRGNRNPQAAQDARAVKHGTATPEQTARNTARVAKKANGEVNLAQLA